jgi:hypothetical protein
VTQTRGSGESPRHRAGRRRGSLYVDADHRHYPTCLELPETHPGPPDRPDAGHDRGCLPARDPLGPEPEVRFLADLAGGAFIVEPVAAGDWMRIIERVPRHHDLPLGTVDASGLAGPSESSRSPRSIIGTSPR